MIDVDNKTNEPCRAIDSGSYDWKKLDPKSEDCKNLITQYWKWEVSFWTKNQTFIRVLTFGLEIKMSSTVTPRMLFGSFNTPFANSGVAY